MSYINELNCSSHEIFDIISWVMGFSHRLVHETLSAKGVRNNNYMHHYRTILSFPLALLIYFLEVKISFSNPMQEKIMGFSHRLVHETLSAKGFRNNNYMHHYRTILSFPLALLIYFLEVKISFSNPMQEKILKHCKLLHNVLGRHLPYSVCYC